MDSILGRTVDQNNCGASIGNFRVTDLAVADDAKIIAESVEILALALEALLDKEKPMGLQISWIKTKVQVFGGFLDNTLYSLFMRVGKTLRFWRISHALVA